MPDPRSRKPSPPWLRHPTAVVLPALLFGCLHTAAAWPAHGASRVPARAPARQPLAAREPAQETAPWPAIVGALEGIWEGEGTLFGNRAAFTMEWTQVLDGRFLRLRFSNGFVNDEVVSPLISAEAFYHVAAQGRLDGHWFDTRGLVLALAAEVTADRIITDWSAPGIESGRTTYRLVDAGTLEVVDEVRSEQGLREFGRATYRRAAPRPERTTAAR